MRLLCELIDRQDVSFSMIFLEKLYLPAQFARFVADLLDLIEQQRLVDDIGASRADAANKRTEAATLRQSAWATFEAALFTATEEPSA